MLTTTDVKSATATAKDRVLWDKPGFGVRIRPSGAKSWLVQYRTQHGQTRRMTLGKISQLPLAKARREADRIIAAARLGQDPAAKRTETRRSPTFKSVAEEWIEKASMRQKTRAEYRRQLKKKIYPALGRQKLRSITQKDVRKLHLAISDAGHPVLANRVLATVSSFFGWCCDRDMIPVNPALGVRRIADAENSDDRALTQEETHRFLRACDTLKAEGGHPARVADCFKLMLLCNMRPSEGYGLRWDQIDWDAGLIHFRPEDAPQKGRGASKVKPRYMRGPAQALLREHEAAKADDEFVFPSRRLRGRPITDARKIWKRIEALAKFDRRANPKHLRKTHSTLAVNWGHDLSLISKSLGHSSQQTTERHYAFIGDNRVRAAEDDIQTRIAALVNPKATVRGIR